MPKFFSLLLRTTSALLVLATAAAAQDYPAKPVRVIVPYPPGALNDNVGRLIASQLSTRLGRQFIVDNRSGAGGVIGAEQVANAPKDGYTLLINSLVNAINPWLYKLPYEPIKAFAPIAAIASSPNVLAVHPDLPVKSVSELIEYAKKHPGQVQYASSGVGTFMHLGGELFKIAAGIDMLHVPFRGGGPAMVDVVGGHTKAIFATVPTTAPQVRSGKVRALGVGASTRQAVLPDVPTIAEAGLPGYEATNWVGIVAPAGTPAPIIEKLHREIAAILELPEVKKQLADQGLDSMRMSTVEFGEFLEKEMNKWGRVVKASGIKPE